MVQQFDCIFTVPNEASHGKKNTSGDYEVLNSFLSFREVDEQIELLRSTLGADTKELNQVLSREVHGCHIGPDLVLDWRYGWQIRSTEKKD